MRGSNLFVWLCALGMSALAWGGRPDHVGTINAKAFQKYLSTLPIEASRRPQGPSRAKAILEDKNPFIDEETIEKNIQSIDGADLLELFNQQARLLVSEIKDYRTKADDLTSLHKKPIDPEADAAIEQEFVILEAKLRTIIKSLAKSPDLLKTDVTKKGLVEMLLHMNQDRLLVNYGLKMQELSRDPKNTGIKMADARIKTLEAMQQAEAKEPRLVKSLAREVSGVLLGESSPRNRWEWEAAHQIFSLKEGQFDPDTIMLGQDMIFDRHVKETIWEE